MKILLTGGSGDLGLVLAKELCQQGKEVINIDIRKPRKQFGQFVCVSVLDRESLNQVMHAVHTVVHIAGWHGIHESRQSKTAEEFWDLNVTGTFNVLQAAQKNQVQQFIYISSTSVGKWPNIYASSKMMGEELTRTYAARHGMKAMTLRPRAFIPHWNRYAYTNYIEWARWFWKGAVHISDVMKAVCCAIRWLQQQVEPPYLALPVDGAYDYSDEQLRNWRPEYFQMTYPGFLELVLSYELDPFLQPTKLDISQTVQTLGYKPAFGLRNVLLELQEFGIQGPPSFF